MNYTHAFEQIIEQQLARIDKIKQSSEPVDYGKLEKIVIGIIGGDGIGPVITEQ
ncbi:MAG: isocitrate/isopropylmalate dehydrogenase family protein, partial [Clostridiales bacterium]|nr:isocitrate/isopropylmalate dehydrogenase family protein [Clostridiales bacterium]